VVASGAGAPATPGTANAGAADRAELPVLTGGAFSTDRLTAEDWHDTRATNDDDTLRRSLIWSWSKALQRLVILTGGVLLYVLAALVARRLDPGLTPADAMKIAGAAVGAGSGGLVISAVTERIRRGRRR
jgi:hypothetical protein